MTPVPPIQRSAGLASLLIAWPFAEERHLLALLQEYLARSHGGRRRKEIAREIGDWAEWTPGISVSVSEP